MKKLISLLLVLVLVLSLCACGGGQEGGKESGKETFDTLQVGYGKAKIQPPDTTIHLTGGGDPNRIATGVLDYLYLTCFAITDTDGATLLIYTVDIQSADDSWTVPAREFISQRTGVPVSNIIFGSTHTHSVPGLNNNTDANRKYNEVFEAGLIKATDDALADRSDAQIQVGTVDGVMDNGKKLACVRHYIMNDGSIYGSNFGTSSSGYSGEHPYDADIQAQLLKFVRPAEDKKDVVLMSFPTHGTFNESGNTLSADFPAPCREYIEANSDSLVAYFMGTAGDQTPSSRIAGEVFSDDYKVYGEKLGQYVLDTLPNLTKADGSGIKFQSETYSFNSNKEGMDKLAQAQEVMQAEKANGRSHPTTKALIQDYGFASFWDAKYTISRSKLGDTLKKTIYTMEVGGISLIVAPYEMFSVHGRHVKENSPYDMTFIITCCEDSGYIPTEAAFGYRSYEAQVTSYAKGTGEALADYFVQLLTQMKTPE